MYFVGCATLLAAVAKVHLARSISNSQHGACCLCHESIRRSFVIVVQKEFGPAGNQEHSRTSGVDVRRMGDWSSWCEIG